MGTIITHLHCSSMGCIHLAGGMKVPRQQHVTNSWEGWIVVV